MRDRVRNIMAAVFKVPPTSVHEDTAFGDLSAWTSLTHAELITQLERQFKIRISNDEFQEMIDFRNVCAVVSSHLADGE